MRKVMIVFFLISFIINPEKIRVTFCSADGENSIFWGKVDTYMKMAADDLDIEFKTIYPQFDHRTELERVALEELNSPQKPDYIIFPYVAGAGKEILEAAEKNKVYSFIFNTDIPENEKEKVGVPGEKFKYWIGHIYPDDFQAGYELGKVLVEEAKEKLGEWEPLYITAINGSLDLKVTRDREKGLKKAIEENETAVLTQVFYAYWEYKRGVEITESLFKRYPETNIIWTASDLLALSVVAAEKSEEKILGKNLFVGGIDWSNIGFSEVKSGRVVASAGGHFLEGVLSLIFVADHAQGIDMSSVEFPLKTPMKIMNSSNVDFYEEVLSPKNFEKLNIKKLSKYYNSERTEYNLNLIDFIIDETK